MSGSRRYQYFSKSKLLSAYVCLKKAHLEKHHPEEGEYSASTQSAFDVGNAVGAIAQAIYGTEGSRVCLSAWMFLSRTAMVGRLWR